MKRTFAITLLALGLLVPTTAQAAFESGTYKGKTRFGGPVSFKATQARLTKFRIAVVFNCTDGDRFQTVLPTRTTFFPGQNIVNGRYNATFTGSGGASRYTNRGSIVNRRAVGYFSGRRTYDTNDQLDPDGTVVCTTGSIRYSIPKL